MAPWSLGCSFRAGTISWAPRRGRVPSLPTLEISLGLPESLSGPIVSGEYIIRLDLIECKGCDQQLITFLTGIWAIIRGVISCSFRAAGATDTSLGRNLSIIWAIIWAIIWIRDVISCSFRAAGATDTSLGQNLSIIWATIWAIIWVENDNIDFEHDLTNNLSGKLQCWHWAKFEQYRLT